MARNLARNLITALVATSMLIATTTLAHAQHADLQHADLLVIEKGAQSLAIVDPATGSKLASVPEGGITGHEVIASLDGKYAYVPIYGNSGVGKPGTDGSKLDVIELASRQVVGTLDFGHGVRPHCPKIGKDGLLYVTTELDQTISVIDAKDPKAPKIVATIPTGQPESHMLILSHNGQRGYTANVGPGTVSVLDIPNRKTLAVLPISKSVQRISISPDDSMVFTSDQTTPQLAVIDTATNKIKKWIPMPSHGYGSAPTPDGRWLLVALDETNKVAVIDLKTLEVAHVIEVPAHPQEVLVRPNGKVAYIATNTTDQVAELDLATWKVTRLIQVGKSADGLAWAAGH